MMQQDDIVGTEAGGSRRAFSTTDLKNGSAAQTDFPEPQNQGPGIVLFNFSGREPAWMAINDTVMGGLSSSSAAINPDLQHLTFSGNVSLENNGGFASIRSQWLPYDLGAFDGIALRVRGDGNAYRLRIRTQLTGADVAYTAVFDTERNVWQEVYMPFSEMVPLYRGYFIRTVGLLDPTTIRSFGLMLADKQTGQFSLDVDWINAVTEKNVEVKLAKLNDIDPETYIGDFS